MKTALAPDRARAVYNLIDQAKHLSRKTQTPCFRGQIRNGAATQTERL
jgi:hypothetical protein